MNIKSYFLFFFIIEKVTYNEKLSEQYNEPPEAQL